MIKLSSYHTHCSFCDGKNTPREMVEEAIRLGCPEIGFSSHSPLPYKDSWAMTEDGISDYMSELSSLRDEYSGKIKVYIGMEEDILSPPPPCGLDYIIGSVHHVQIPGGYLSVDESAATTREGVEKYFDGDPYAFAESYYGCISEIYTRTGCDIVGHFDLLTKFIERDPLIDEKEPRYLRARDAALESLLSSPAVFEVNTGAISRGYRTAPYPHPSVLERIRAAGKPVIVTSDTHSVGTLDFLLDETAARLSADGMHVITSMDELLEYTRK